LASKEIAVAVDTDDMPMPGYSGVQFLALLVLCGVNGRVYSRTFVCDSEGQVKEMESQSEKGRKNIPFYFVTLYSILIVVTFLMFVFGKDLQNKDIQLENQ
jgi:hypothetical protein